MPKLSLNASRKTKHTPAGEIPVDWGCVTLDKEVTFRSGKTPSRENKDFWGGSIPWFSGKDLKSFNLHDSTEHIAELALRNGSKVYSSGSILILVRGMALIKEIPVGILRQPGAINQDVKALTVDNEQIHPDFLAYYLFSKKSQIQEFVTLAGHGTGRLPLEDLKAFPVILPSINEQQRIVTILSTWDTALEKLDALIRAKQQQKKALMQQLLTGKRRLPGFEGEFIFKKASEVFCSVSRRNTDDYPVLSVTQDQGIVMRDTLERRITSNAENNKSYKVVQAGDFVISLRSFQGGLEYSNVQGAVSPAYHVIRPRIKIAPGFFCHFFKSSHFIGRLSIAVIGIRDGKQISFSDFSFMDLPCPDYREQKAIASILDASEREINILKNQREAIDRQKRALMQQLLSGKVRVAQ